MTDRSIRSDSPDADLLQWVFDTDRFVEQFDKPVSTLYLCQALRDLTVATSKWEEGAETHAHEVKLAWQMLYDVAGPWLTGQFISTGAWHEFCPPAGEGRDAPGLATVWKLNDKSVVARVTYIREVPCNILFTIE